MSMKQETSLVAIKLLQTITITKQYVCTNRKSGIFKCSLYFLFNSYTNLKGQCHNISDLFFYLIFDYANARISNLQFNQISSQTSVLSEQIGNKKLVRLSL